MMPRVSARCVPSASTTARTCRRAASGLRSQSRSAAWSSMRLPAISWARVSCRSRARRARSARRPASRCRAANSPLVAVSSRISRSWVRCRATVAQTAAVGGATSSRSNPPLIRTSVATRTTVVTQSAARGSRRPGIRCATTASGTANHTYPVVRSAGRIQQTHPHSSRSSPSQAGLPRVPSRSHRVSPPTYTRASTTMGGATAQHSHVCTVTSRARVPTTTARKTRCGSCRADRGSLRRADREGGTTAAPCWVTVTTGAADFNPNQCVTGVNRQGALAGSPCGAPGSAARVQAEDAG